MVTFHLVPALSLSHEPLHYLFTIFTGMRAFDLIFIITAIAFNLLIAGIFISSKLELPKIRQTLGIVWLFLTFPLTVVFINYLIEGRKPGIYISFGLVLLYMLVEFLLDYVFKIEFREKAVTHVPYIILEYIALFSLIGIATDIDRTWGWIVGISFWILMGSLIYLYWDKITRKKPV